MESMLFFLSWMFTIRTIDNTLQIILKSFYRISHNGLISMISIIESLIFGFALLYTFPLMKSLFDTNFFLILVLFIGQNSFTIINNSYRHEITEHNLRTPYYFGLLADPYNLRIYNVRQKVVHITAAIFGISASILILNHFLDFNDGLNKLIEIESINETVKTIYVTSEKYYLNYILSALSVLITIVTMKRMNSINDEHKILYPNNN